ncbi:hypothetical protein COCSADRAFT_38609 [Bipolaris sorokiniana ND90Pr]|uniref:Uncharacterized protein n=1 Tax=Cochliobolus sativus (strain ND90Pr / ATCC 201652) TaxID=665912 RepID=M2SHA0_COCSN|nr:uncharacterized protein COCSADRAFT_38609 [Bipolaris sorokiniana ND90Pr]EMD61790.1 hypothetical protein COCSADRAFT_38609 [Bipolaris sorokiniana ND90Pr]
MDSKWNRDTPVSNQETSGAWSNSYELKAWMQGKLQKNESDVVDMGDRYGGDKGAENGNDKAANNIMQRSELEQRRQEI